MITTTHCSPKYSMKRIFLTIIVFFFFLVELVPHAAAQSPNEDRYGYRTDFKPSMVVTVVVLAVACLFIAFFSFAIRRCARDNHIAGGSFRMNRTRPAPPGLDATVIETFPTFLYSEVKGLKIGKEVLECAVCLNEFEDEETLRLLPKCNHVFHPECIDAWLSSHTTCPVCRADLVPNPLSTEGTDQQVQPVDATAEVPLPPAVEAEIAAESSRQVSIRVAEDQSDEIASGSSKPEVINPSQRAFPVQNHPERKGNSKRFPRSHSTGHSVVQPGDNHDKFTLKLPEDVRKRILNRTTSLITLPAQGAVCRNGGSQSGRLDRGTRSERWLNRATSFFWRNNSGRLSKKGAGSISGKSDGTGGLSLPTTPRPPV